MSTNSKQVDALNKLITTLYDGEEGYKEAATDVENVALKTRFRSLAQQRYDFGHELKPFFDVLGGKVDKGSSLAAGAHRIWIDLKTAVVGNDDAAVLAEVVRGEESALESYSEVLAHNDLPAAARTTITAQRDKIQTALNEMRKMKKVA
ncbi:ferritin-like domain-containing protein [Neolewinella antarctica]|uniref:Uncharacterized protein (TIGR02284 family) n=1 Tax=Neolewinella antarctica TaxID=442734 RepID=A0ABX0XC33_9BACT|nr:PA2169 family four-helix-bundle protein [Neolewinella antarctica]NJC26828.1 uncharacterized protein (TIGR02284 family) [Neolewinella antarctica]